MTLTTPELQRRQEGLIEFIGSQKNTTLLDHQTWQSPLRVRRFSRALSAAHKRCK